MCSASFSMPRWRYPTWGVHFTTVSPSRSRTSRKTPWVAGCCGPMLIVSSLVRSSFAFAMLFRLVFLVLLGHGQYLSHPLPFPFAEVALQRVILPEGMPFPVLGQQDPAEIGVAGEGDAEQVVTLPLVPVRSVPDRHDTVDLWVALGDLGLDPDCVPVADGIELVHHLEPPLFPAQGVAPPKVLKVSEAVVVVVME